MAKGNNTSFYLNATGRPLEKWRRTPHGITLPVIRLNAAKGTLADPPRGRRRRIRRKNAALKVPRFSSRQIEVRPGVARTTSLLQTTMMKQMRIGTVRHRGRSVRWMVMQKPENDLTLQQKA